MARLAACFVALSVLSAGMNAVAQSDNSHTDVVDGPLVRALVVSRDRAVLSAEIAARIAEMPSRPGDRFVKGDRLVRFDCSRFVAQRDVGAADVEAAQKSLQSVEKLRSLNAAGQLEVEIAAAQLAKTEAQQRLFQSDVNRCTIGAPFDGRVVAWHANPHEVANPGDDLVEIVAAGNLEIEMIVPSSWLSWLAPDLSFAVAVDETGNRYEAKVTKLGAEVDPVSQTVAIRARFDSAPQDLLPGMSGTAIFPQGQ